MTVRHLIPVSFVLTGLALSAGDALANGDSERLARFADGAHAAGTLTMTLTYEGDPDTCSAAGVCGVSGQVVTKLPVARTKRVRVRDGVAVLSTTGTAKATVTDSVAGDVCRATARVTATGIGIKGDRNGVLLRVGVFAGDDPFDTACRAPTLKSLGETALPSVRMRNVKAGIDKLALRVDHTRPVRGDGYRGTLKTEGTIGLRG